MKSRFTIWRDIFSIKKIRIVKEKRLNLINILREDIVLREPLESFVELRLQIESLPVYKLCPQLWHPIEISAQLMHNFRMSLILRSHEHARAPSNRCEKSTWPETWHAKRSQQKGRYLEYASCYERDRSTTDFCRGELSKGRINRIAR